MDTSRSDISPEMDFLTMLEESFAFEQPERGDLLTGTVLAIDNQGMIVDVGMKRDGVVPRNDLERMEGITYHVNDEIAVMVLSPEDQDGNLVLSVSQARQSEDWTKAEELMESGDIWEGVVTDANRGGLIVPFGNLRGFVPASHVMDLPRGLNENDRKGHMSSLVGKRVSVKVIEVNRKRRRLVLSQRDAQRGRRDLRKETLLEELQEGEVRKGVVSGLRDFGAFVDLGGADGLIHISELAWHRVKHPRELLNVGDEIDVYILRLDRDGKRIGLSLKRLQPNPWAMVDEMYHVGQLIEGEVSRVAQFGAFVSLEPGIEALLHTSQMADPAPEDPTGLLREGQKLLMRVISIESHRQRLGLSLKDVTEDERERWTAEHGTILTVVPPGTGAKSESDVDLEPAVEVAEEATAE
ncbi:MAG: S1 RNA-binding domain-containing protein [Anaerolineae bacterium]|nr:S1 RNA-binding domain-containing protein [Anaerolineae bacterium]